MSVKDFILKKLEENRGEPLSGEALANMLSVSRAAVWKAVHTLQQAGYHIEAVPNRGYTLCTDNDILSVEGILPFLKEKTPAREIRVLSSTGSTNQEAKKMALEGAMHGSAVLAEEQSAGRGRLGRSFFSPRGSGLYMSVILRPQADAADAVLITTAAAVAVCLAIERIAGKQPRIKWVNDLYLGDQKICGILTEAVTNFETGAIESVVVGIGVNFRGNASLLPEELRTKAGFLLPDETVSITRNQLAAEIMNQLCSLCDTMETRSFLPEYRRRSMTLGEKIRFLRNNQWFEATAIDIDQNGGLIVTRTDGTRETLNSGEISIRRLETS
ncbi:MAG TPA: biotin--[acetyl-CoA-carboxylase] ligase [Candidatus Fimivicinus intestinavium]|nr:biotin--[acetyl-CoA-carboxylase] ligase [Candidatus Fimivicinus intestinavium]